MLILSLVAGCAGQAPQPTPAAPAAAEPTKAPSLRRRLRPTAVPEPTKAPEPTVAPAAEGPVPGGILVVGSPQEPETLSPLLSAQTIANAVSSLVVEGLVEVDAEGKYAPVLAEALPAVSDDGLTVTYKLKQGVKFSNGDPFTCADEQFTKDTILSDLSQAGTRATRALTRSSARMTTPLS